MQANGGKLAGHLGQIAREIVEAHCGDGAGSGELATQLVKIGELAADAHRDRDRHRQQSGILRAEERIEEARPGVGRDQQPLAGREACADQLAGGDMRPVPHLAPRQGRKQLALGIKKSDPGLALSRVVQHLRHRPEDGAVQSKRSIAGGKQVHRAPGS